uniref:Uncharacterized protein n=1 Tax=Corethron hystrix TaxID=216773 RepID=A0A7S1BGD4_9STRA|mmetsp:Transcript_25046/g.57878  ORF Transcript_25046/g.57878 Transcript_25046/m.57878 type:complete len:158 (+) Transcript_25046:100-573(+)
MIRILLPPLAVLFFIRNAVYASKGVHDGSCITCKVAQANSAIQRSRKTPEPKVQASSVTTTLGLITELLTKINESSYPQMTGEELIDHKNLSVYYTGQEKRTSGVFTQILESIEARGSILSDIKEAAAMQTQLEESGFVPHPDQKNELSELVSNYLP